MTPESTSTPPPECSAATQIRLNRIALERILDEADAFVRAGRHDECAATLQIAGFHAWRNHPGVYFSSRLESLGADLSRSVERARPALARPGVVHVLTEASQVGGHTRLAWRWINNDTRRHSVVLTSQRGARVPADLEAAVAQSGGTFTDLSATHRGLMARANGLAALVDGADAVIVHAHPHDVVPLLALSGASAPVAIVNHADHVFWTGGSTADVLINLRDSGRELSIQHRDMRPEDCVLLPLPLDAPTRPESDEVRFREDLDVPQAAPLAITIASQYKFNSPGEVHYLSLHEELMRRHPSLHIRVAGPSREGMWAEVERRTGGRLRAMGKVNDVEPLYVAADLYLDSFPMGSLTSLLDAAARGIPVVSFSAIATPHVMTSDDPSLAPFPVYFSDRDAYLRQADALLRDRSVGRRVGSEMAKEVARLHTTEWAVELEHTYEALRDAFAAGRSERQVGGIAPAVGVSPLPVQELLIEVHEGSGMSVPLWQARMLQAPHVSMATRLAWLRTSPVRVWPFLVPYLVADVRMARLRPWARRLHARLGAVRRVLPH